MVTKKRVGMVVAVISFLAVFAFVALAITTGNGWFLMGMVGALLAEIGGIVIFWINR